MVVSCAAFGCENRWIPKKELLPGQKNISFHFLLFLCIYLMWRVMLRRSGKLAIRNGWMAPNNCPGVLHWTSRYLLYQYQGPLHKVFLDCLKKGAFCSMLRHFFHPTSITVGNAGKRIFLSPMMSKCYSWLHWRIRLVTTIFGDIESCWRQMLSDATAISQPVLFRRGHQWYDNEAGDIIKGRPHICADPMTGLMKIWKADSSKLRGYSTVR